VSDNQKRMTFSDAARELQVSQSELETLVAAGEIASIKEGDTLLFKADDIAQFKKTRKTEPTIILSDDELDLLDDVESISLDDLDLGDAGGTEAISAADELSTEPVAADGGSGVGDDFDLDELELSDLSLDGDDAAATETSGTEDAVDDITLEEAASPLDADTSDDTVLSLDGLLDDEGGSESTTPVPGTDLGDLELTDTSDDITMEGSLRNDDTVLDTDVLDLDIDDDSGFELDPTTDGLMPSEDASTLLRGGGARVMQMKRVKGHPVMTTVLLLTGIVLLVPLATLVNIYFFDRIDGPSSLGTSQWIGEYNMLRGSIESVADFVRGLFA